MAGEGAKKATPAAPEAEKKARMVRDINNTAANLAIV
jgi:hypothetical protein